MDRLLARDPAMARSWLLAHLILALLIEDAAGEILDSPPCTSEWPDPSGVVVAPARRSERRVTRRSLAPAFTPGPATCQGLADTPHLRSAPSPALSVSLGAGSTAIREMM